VERGQGERFLQERGEVLFVLTPDPSPVKTSPPTPLHRRGERCAGEPLLLLPSAAWLPLSCGEGAGGEVFTERGAGGEDKHPRLQAAAVLWRVRVNSSSFRLHSLFLILFITFAKKQKR
jgi:hypothetical protein